MKCEIEIGDYKLIQTDTILWLMNKDGEGTGIDIKDFEKLIAKYFEENY